jgi:hypothetical protein
MTRVLCALDASPAALAAAESAIAFCVEHGAELELLSVVDRGRQRAAQASARLEEARGLAEAAGLAPRTETRSGLLLREMQRRALESKAQILFFARTRRKWWATLTGRPRVEIKQITIAWPPSRRPVRAADAAAVTGGVRTDLPRPVPRVVRHARGGAAAESGRHGFHSIGERQRGRR